jgi:glutamyl-tRNA reductase
VLDTEMERATKQHGCGATADDVNIALRRVVRRLLHLPMVRAREPATAGRQDDYAAALEALFGLSVELPNPRQPGIADQSGENSAPGVTTASHSRCTFSPAARMS